MVFSAMRTSNIARGALVRNIVESVRVPLAVIVISSTLVPSTLATTRPFSALLYRSAASGPRSKASADFLKVHVGDRGICLILEVRATQ